MIKHREIPIEQTNPVKELIFRALEYKWIYIISLALFLIYFAGKNKYAPRTYENSATILLNKNPKSMLGGGNVLTGLEALEFANNVENEVAVLSSYTLVSNTLFLLDFDVSYYHIKDDFLGKIIGNSAMTTELYTSSPFKIVLDKTHVQPINSFFDISIVNDSVFVLEMHEDKPYLYNYLDGGIRQTGPIYFRKQFQFGKMIDTSFCRFSVTITDLSRAKELQKTGKLAFVMNHPEQIALQYQRNIKAEAKNPGSSVIKITLKGNHEKKVTDFLNKHIDTYLTNNLNKKNKIAVSTIEFIDSQLSDISDSLTTVERRLQSYRSSHQITNLSFQGQKYIEQQTQLENEKARLVLQKRYYDYLVEYLSSNKDGADLVPPSTMNVVDPVMNQLVVELINNNAERASILQNENIQNLFLGQIENKINNLKKTILENARNNLNTIQISINELDYRSKVLANEIARLPGTELQLVGIERKFKLNDAIYTYLLEKRAEAQIARASNTPDFEVIDLARDSMVKAISPKRRLNLVLAVLLGLLLPTVYILLKEFFNVRISEIRDIEAISNLPFLGAIVRSRKETPLVVKEHPRSIVSESFRALRTNIQIRMGTDRPVVLVVTSSTSREGKSFIALNLASSFASFGGKTVLLEFDMHKPVLTENLKLKSGKGLSNFLDGQAAPEEIILASGIEGLDFISSGPVPFNPSELISTQKVNELFEFLKQRYHYIVLDTPPLAAVADTYLLMKHADMNILVTCRNTTPKSLFTAVLANLENNNIENLQVVLNNYELRNGRDEYSYDYSYVQEEGRRKGLSRYLKKFLSFGKLPRVRKG
ncbi:MAG: polysaccharide biosynthesis tyrosine autokinase [Bacteroidales bacterium]|nr:polysaccharide biosynthesis tyrosine autokinase [Bacteroidales bacterium]